MKGQLLQEMRNPTGISHFVPWTRVNHHTDCAKLTESLFRSHPQSIGQCRHLGCVPARLHGSVLDVFGAR